MRNAVSLTALLRTTALCLAVSAVPAFAQERSEEDIKALALQAILENPEIIMEAVQLLERNQGEAQAAQTALVLENQRELLENDPNAPILGNPDGDITIVEFFDYNCPYCKRAMGEVDALLAEDPNVRVVYREWPILGEGSVFASRAALAARKQGKYEPFHIALMTLPGRATEASVMRIAKSLDMDIAQLRADMNAPEVEAHIRNSVELGQMLGFSGTPSFVVGTTLLPGFVEANVLAEAVENARLN